MSKKLHSDLKNPAFSHFLCLPPGPFSQFSRSVMSDSLRPHGLQHARPPCPSPTPRVYSNSCVLRQWGHPTISSSVVPFSSCPQSFPASGSFQMSQLFPSGGQRIGVSSSTLVLPMNIQDWFPLGWTGWISYFQGTLKSLLQQHSSKASIFQLSGPLLPQNMWFPVSLEVPAFLCLSKGSGWLQDVWFSAIWPEPHFLCSYIAVCFNITICNI